MIWKILFLAPIAGIAYLLYKYGIRITYKKKD